MSEIENLRNEVAHLREEVARLRADHTIHHYHHAPSLLPPHQIYPQLHHTYYPPSYPAYLSWGNQAIGISPSTVNGAVQ